jgi:hypothetical protein
VERLDDGDSSGPAIAQRVQSVPQREQLYAQLVTSAPTLESHWLRMQVTTTGGVLESETKWVVCNALTMTEEMKELCLSRPARGLKLIPWGGVAVRIGDEPIKGTAFSFLPLPIETGLPVHVNGYFEVAPDRERLWTMREGLEGVAFVKALWNQHLISEVVSLCYCKALTMLAVPLEQIHFKERTFKQFFALWPTEAGEPWNAMVKRLYLRLALQRVLPGPAQWLRAAPADDEPQPPKAVLRAEQDASMAMLAAPCKNTLCQTANRELERGRVRVCSRWC